MLRTYDLQVHTKNAALPSRHYQLFLPAHEYEIEQNITENGVYNHLYHSSPFLTKNVLAGKIFQIIFRSLPRK